MTEIELLAPAKDLDGGRAAIDSGADALYIGAPRFGARARAGNSLDDIARLVEHAHTYWARVYVTVNTLLYDHELPEAAALLHELYALGADAAIIQDMGLLECDLPPLPLIASTQMHNHTPERVAFLEQVGIRRAILARELSLEQIRAIRARTGIELEMFVHGALCVSYSGQCTMSYAIGGRSGNRGECAQPCRRRYTLLDDGGQVLAANRYLLSLRDLSLGARLADLLDAGVTSFKIEGRLKDRAYVVNVVSWYRRELDRLLAERRAQGQAVTRSSSGHSRIDFEPDRHKTFNRGYTTYFLDGRGAPPGALDSPKMMGEPAGKVAAVEGDHLLLDTELALGAGDGLCWLDRDGELVGTVVNGVQPLRPGVLRVTPERMGRLRAGLMLYRNHDHAFLRRVERSRPVRTIGVRLRLEATAGRLALHAADEDGNHAESALDGEWSVADKPEQAAEMARRQLARMGNTSFECSSVELAWQQPVFVPVAALNALRRSTLERLAAERAANRPVLRGSVRRNEVPYPETRLSYRGNVLNRRAAEFYRRHGVAEIEPAAESGLDMRGRGVMRTRYCLKHQLGLCDGQGRRGRAVKEPLWLVDDDGHRYRLRFDCAACEMEIFY